MDNQEKDISSTYLWFLKESEELVGYVSVLTDSINISHDLKEQFRSKNIIYKSLPALKIGRLCVDDRFSRRGIGALMVKFVFELLLKINFIAGCRFVTLDAKRNPEPQKDSLHFYKKMGFDILRERQKGSVPMYKDLLPIIKAYKEELNKRG